jgi:arylsulfatase A-like enzyme
MFQSPARRPVTHRRDALRTAVALVAAVTAAAAGCRRGVAHGVAAVAPDGPPADRAGGAAGGASVQRPNVVLVVVDDLGWAELGAYGNRFNETPHLDRLARDGARFTQAYASSPVCSPTRAALMTGQYPARVAITDYLRPRDTRYLDPARVEALPRQLKRAGYATGLVGKWHLMGDYAARRGDPAKHGFDEVLLSETRYIGPGDYFHPYDFMPEVAARHDGEYLVDRMNDEAVAFIRRNAARPFFLEVSHYAVHTDLAGAPDAVAKYAARPGAGAGPKAPRNNVHLAAQLEAVDDGVGAIMATLRELGLDGRTLVVFTSDNGGETGVTSNAPLRAGKSTLYEGGVRVPLVVRGPGVARGLVTDAYTTTVDLFPTLLAAAGVRPDPSQPVDGVDIGAALRGDRAFARGPVFWHYPLREPHFLGGRSGSSVRDGSHKLIEFLDRDEVELYDLVRDPGETRNLAGEQPARAAAMRAQLAAWRRALRTDTLTLPTGR